MMINHIVVISIAAICFSLAASADNLTSSHIMTQEEKARARELVHMSREERVKRNGGMLYSAPTGNVIRAINAQNIVSFDSIDPMIDGFKVALGLTIFKSDVAGGNAYQIIKKGFSLPKTGAVLALVDAQDLPRLIVAPEEPWAIVNVRALVVDKPSDDQLRKRVIKESWRGLAIALGASDSVYRPCLLSPIHSLNELDANTSLVVCPEPFNAMSDNAEVLGIKRVRRATYLTACREGWAPAPTNDIQKAIWDKVHKLPTEPIKIEPEAKKVKE